MSRAITPVPTHSSSDFVSLGPEGDESKQLYFKNTTKSIRN